MTAAGKWVATEADDDVRRHGIGLDADDDDWAPVEVPGPVRLAIELAVLGGGWLAYSIAGHPAIGTAFAALTVAHYTVARPRVQWLLSR